MAHSLLLPTLRFKEATHPAHRQWGFGEEGPHTGWVTSVDDIIKYADFLDAHVNRLNDAWNHWHDANYWDGGGGVCGPDTPNPSAETCHPEFFDQLNRANKWSQEVVTPNGWEIWREDWKKYYAVLQSRPVWLEIETQACGGFCGEWETVSDRHQELTRFSEQAKKYGLKDVPNPGEKPTTGPEDLVKSAEDTTSALLTTALWVGGIGLAAWILLNAPKTGVNGSVPRK